MLRLLSQRLDLFFQEMVAFAPALIAHPLPCLDLVVDHVSDHDATCDSVDFNDCGMLLMGYAPKRKKSVKMKRIERNKPWKIPEDIPYTTCTDCGAPRRVYFMCEVCYAKVKLATEELQTHMKEKIAGMTFQRKVEETYLKYKPQTYEEQLEPYLEKYTLERLKPKPVKPIGETWKDNIDDYKRWYLEDGDPVLPPKTDQDVDMISDTDLISDPNMISDPDLISDPNLISDPDLLSDPHLISDTDADIISDPAQKE